MSISNRTALQRISSHIAQSPIEPSAQSLDLVRDALIDTYGCMLIGANQPVSVKTRQALIDTGQINSGAGAVIFGTGDRATPNAAAMANAIAGHALEFDDWEIPGNTHVSVLLMPAILAAGCQRKLSGAEAIEAYLAGYETIARIGEAINLEHYDQGWHATATIGAIGVAAAVSRLSGLDSEKTANALAIATSRALGYNAQFGSEAKPLQVGFAVDGGIMAAHMAAAGLAGQAHIFEHDNGMAALMGHRFSHRIEAAMAKIGSTAAIDEHHIVFKPWPSCGYTHRIMTGMLELHAQGIDVDAIESIELHLPNMHAGILPFAQPSSQSEALFSLPYCATMMLLYGDLSITDLAEASWQRENVKRIIAITSVTGFEPDRPQLNFDPDQPDRIVIRCGGAIRTVEIAYPLGTPQNPMTESHLRQKFILNTGLDPGSADDYWGRLHGWPRADDIHRLFTAMP